MIKQIFRVAFASQIKVTSNDEVKKLKYILWGEWMMLKLPLWNKFLHREQKRKKTEKNCWVLFSIKTFAIPRSASELNNFLRTRERTKERKKERKTKIHWTGHINSHKSIVTISQNALFFVVVQKELEKPFCVCKTCAFFSELKMR